MNCSRKEIREIYWNWMGLYYRKFTNYNELWTVINWMSEALFIIDSICVIEYSRFYLHNRILIVDTELISNILVLYSKILFIVSEVKNYKAHSFDRWPSSFYKSLIYTYGMFRKKCSLYDFHEGIGLWTWCMMDGLNNWLNFCIDLNSGSNGIHIKFGFPNENTYLHHYNQNFQQISIWFFTPKESRWK